MEKVFKTLFVLGIIVYSAVVVALFLLALKVILLFTEQINIFGLTIV